MLKFFDLLPTPLNTANDTSPSGFANIRTLQQTNAGGLVLGDYIDLDNMQAAGLSSPQFGTLFEGRYRRVQVDANATAANVGVGKAAFVVPGYSLLAALTLTAGTGQTPGTYQIAGVGGGGTGAILQVVVTPAGTVTASPTVIAKGTGYTSIPTFTVAAGGTPATVLAQMVVNTYIVTSQDKAGINAFQGRGVFLNAVTPGNYGWIQENGIATFLIDSTLGNGSLGATLSPVGATVPGAFRGVVGTTAPLYSAFGTAIDIPAINILVRGVMTLPVWNG
jgi:hypothetical protein